MIWSDFTVTLKLRPGTWLNMYQVLSDAAYTAQESLKTGFMAVDQNFITAAEFCRKITPSQYAGWVNRNSAKVYNYKMPFSVAISLCRILQSLPRPDSSHVALHESVAVRLYDSGVDIQHYFRKK